jgi:hypothetical protein
MSEISKRITGTYIDDDAASAPPVQRWVLAELRGPRFQRVLEQFAARQPEALDVRLVQLQEIRADALVCRIPCCVVDHESPHPFRSEVVFQLDPLSGNTLRL